MPLPPELKIALGRYERGSREWEVTFYLTGSPNAIDSVLKHEHLRHCDPGTPAYDSFKDTTRMFFGAPGLPSMKSLEPGEAYQNWEGKGPFTFMFVKKDKSAAWVAKYQQ
jgi:hypothetical protein